MVEYPGATASIAEALEEYRHLLATDGRRLGLIGFPEDRIGTEIARSLLFDRLIPPGIRAIDVGTGAGFPGIPLAILGGNISLVEPRARAVGFLEKVVRRLGLDTQIFLGTAEEVAGKGICESADYVLARALAPPAQAVRICSVLCRPGGKIVLTAGPKEVRPHLEGPFRWEGTVTMTAGNVQQHFNVIEYRAV